MLTRFAPAPTGYLHLGHVVNALYVWGEARARGARVLLRLEDHDRQRCRPEYERALLDDLDWLNLRPDLGTTDDFRRGASPYRQSDNQAAYAAHVELLGQRGHHVFACDCSRATESLSGGGEQSTRPYSGRCRTRGLVPGPGLGLRVALPAGEERFEDERLGPQRQEPARQCGDLLIRDRVGNWTYQFAVVVDDFLQGVDLIVRGEDLLESTGRQLLLARMLGREGAPVFLHHPLIRRPDGTKLSKANRDTGVRELREQGVSPEAVYGMALFAAGLVSESQPVDLDTATWLTALS